MLSLAARQIKVKEQQKRCEVKLLGPLWLTSIWPQAHPTDQDWSCVYQICWDELATLSSRWGHWWHWKKWRDLARTEQSTQGRERHDDTCYVATERQPELRLRDGAWYNSTRVWCTRPLGRHVTDLITRSGDTWIRDNGLCTNKIEKGREPLVLAE